MRTIYSIIVTVLTLSIGVLSNETVLALDDADDVSVNTTVENDNDQLFKTENRQTGFLLEVLQTN